MEIVYLFRQLGTNYVKIGMTSLSSCDERFQAFKTYSPLGAEIVGTIRTKNALKLERHLHKKYAHKRLNGEFFDLSDNDCDIILNLNEDNEVNNLINKIKILHSAGDMESIHNLSMKATSFIKNITEESKDPLIDLVNEHFEVSDKYELTPTEIASFLNKKQNHDISVVTLGLSLSKFFDNKRARRNGRVQNLYKIRLKS